jgi:hypothetical protein
MAEIVFFRFVNCCIQQDGGFCSGISVESVHISFEISLLFHPFSFIYGVCVNISIQCYGYSNLIVPKSLTDKTSTTLGIHIRSNFGQFVPVPICPRPICPKFFQNGYNFSSLKILKKCVCFGC